MLRRDCPFLPPSKALRLDVNLPISLLAPVMDTTASSPGA